MGSCSSSSFEDRLVHLHIVIYVGYSTTLFLSAFARTTMLAMRTNLQLAISEVLSSHPCSSPSCPTLVDKFIPEISLSKLICAYINIAGFSETSHALPSFERALEKFPDFESSKQPDSAEEGAYWAKLVSSIRKEYWREVLYKDTYGTKKTSYPCPCCGKPVRAEQMKKTLGLEGDESEAAGDKMTKCDTDREFPLYSYQGNVVLKLKTGAPTADVAKGPRKAKRRTVHTRKGSKRPVFDPYGPSTSKVSM